jgi:hypothetical protein
LSRRGDWWKDAEILMLRHRLAVALGERPVVPCVRPGPFGEKMTFDNPNGLGGPPS